MEIIRIGLDLAKNVFEVCGVDMRDAVVLRKTLRRDAVPQFFNKLPPCLIGMEACSSSHYWAAASNGPSSYAETLLQTCGYPQHFAVC